MFLPEKIEGGSLRNPSEPLQTVNFALGIQDGSWQFNTSVFAISLLCFFRVPCFKKLCYFYLARGRTEMKMIFYDAVAVFTQYCDTCNFVIFLEIN